MSFGDAAGDRLEITVDGEIFGTYSVIEDREIVIHRNNHENIVTISGGTVKMASSDCRGQDCVRQHSISKTGETIVCLPNRIILEIKGKDAAYDSISR